MAESVQKVSDAPPDVNVQHWLWVGSPVQSEPSWQMTTLEVVPQVVLS